MKKEFTNQNGQMLILIMIALFTVLFTVLFVIGGSQVYYQSSLYSSDSERAIALAEAGIDKAVASLNIPGSNYNGEPETAFGDGYYSVTITTTSNLFIFKYLRRREQILFINPGLIIINNLPCS